MLVSVTNAGAQGNSHSVNASISGDASAITFDSQATNLVETDTNGATDVFRKTGTTGAIEIVSANQSNVQGNGNSTAPSASGSGGVVAYISAANNLAASDTNNVNDVFVAAEATPTPSPSPSPSKLANISTRGVVGTAPTC